MAATRYHVRSISLPSRSHPSTIRIEEELNKFKILDPLSRSSTGSICTSLSGLEELYQRMDDLLNIVSTRQVLFRNRNKKCIEELLDGSVKLLDVCEITKDMLSQIKEHVQCLQSALRRRKGDSSAENSISTYISFRKKMKKDSKRLVAALKQMENKLVASPISDQDHHLSAVIRVLREVNMTTISIFQSLLLFLTMPGSKPTQGKWSLVCKLIHKGLVACDEKQESLNELEIVDAALCEGVNIEKMQITNKRLEALETSIQELENGLESVFRRLIKARASVLNIFSQ